MNIKTRKLTVSAMMTALSVTALYVSSFFSAGQIAVVAFASLFVVAAVIDCDRRYGIGVYVASLILGFLIVPSKESTILFSVFFGIYPVLKSVFEHFKNRIIEWILKICSFNILFSVVWLLVGKVIFSEKVASMPLFIIYLICNIAFILYDLGVSKLIFFYIERISKKIKR